MSGRGLLVALAFVLILVVAAWLTGDKSPLADKPPSDSAGEPASE